MSAETLQSKIDRRQALLQVADEARREAGMLEQEIVEEMLAMDATIVPHPDFKVTLPTKREYDVQKVATLAEKIEPEQFARLYQPEREELVVRPPKVDGRVALELMKMGYKADLEACLLPAQYRLKVEPKGEKS